MRFKGMPNSQTKLWGLTLPNFKTCHKTTVIESVVFAWRDRPIAVLNREELSKLQYST